MHGQAQDEVVPIVFSLADSQGESSTRIRKGETREVADHQRGYLALESCERTQDHRHNSKESVLVMRWSWGRELEGEMIRRH